MSVKTKTAVNKRMVGVELKLDNLGNQIKHTSKMNEIGQRYQSNCNGIGDVPSEKEMQDYSDWVDAEDDDTEFDSDEGENGSESNDTKQPKELSEEDREAALELQFEARWTARISPLQSKLDKTTAELASAMELSKKDETIQIGGLAMVVTSLK